MGKGEGKGEGEGEGKGMEKGMESYQIIIIIPKEGAIYSSMVVIGALLSTSMRFCSILGV